MTFLVHVNARAERVVQAAKLKDLAGRELTRTDVASATLWFAEPLFPDGNGVSTPRTPAQGGHAARVGVACESAGVTITRDALATLPLWVARSGDSLAITPEAKLLLAVPGVDLELHSDEHLTRPGPRPDDDSPFRHVRRLPPCDQVLARPDGTVECSEPYPVRTDKGDPSNPEAFARALGDALELSAKDAPPGLPRASLLSGGIDSSLATRLWSGGGPAHSLGTPLGDEFEQAADVARHLGVEHHRHSSDEADIARAFEAAVWENEIFDGLSAESLSQLLLLAEFARAHEGRPLALATGYGADLLLGGMMEHKAYLEAVGVRTEEQLVRRTRWTNELSPLFAWRRGIRLHHVFWHPELLDAGLRIPVGLNTTDGHLKLVLRREAVRRGWLPEPLAMGRKRALTDGTRANALLSRHLGLEGDHEYAAKTRAAAAVWRARAATFVERA